MEVKFNNFSFMLQVSCEEIPEKKLSPNQEIPVYIFI